MSDLEKTLAPCPDRPLLEVPAARDAPSRSERSAGLHPLSPAPRALLCLGERDGRLRVRVANSLSRRQACYRLGYEVYRERGYLRQQASRLLVGPHDARPDTLTLLAENPSGHPVGTVTLLFDSEEGGLPCDELFPGTLQALRRKGRALVEATRFAIAPSQQGNRRLSLLLLNLIFLYGLRCKGCDELIAEVHPHHAGFYRNLLGFELREAPRACPRVEGAPAVLLGLRRETYLQGCARAREASPPWRLYRQFFGPQEEAAVGRHLMACQRQMGGNEVRYFWQAQSAAARQAQASAS